MAKTPVRRPPMGWNSWDCFGTTVTEAEVLANAEFMAAHLLEFGWDTVVVDIDWYDPAARAHGYNDGTSLVVDAFGRQLPAENRFPSAAGGRGFGPLADAVHALGLRFGVHLMRGIPRIAVDADLHVEGTAWTARDAADTTSVCPWNEDNYGLDHDHPAAQAYLDGLVAQLAGWGVDFLKVDDMLAPYHPDAVEAWARAIERSGRDIVLSLSPGTHLSTAHVDHLREHAQMWRISDDLWDRWEDVHAQFARLARWAPFQRPGGWADADMLPLGRLALGERRTRFTPDEQRTMMSLWAIARSPLIMGGDLRALDAETLALLTNDAIIAVDQHSRDGRQLYRTDRHIAWTARDTRSHDSYVALFNLGEAADEVSVDLAAAGAGSAANVTDLWEGTPLGHHRTHFSARLPAHGAGLFRLARA